MTILNTIIEKNRAALEARKKAVPLSELERRNAKMPPPRDFAAALRRRDRINVIAELKKASPSKGVIRADFDFLRFAAEYEAAGAAALSVLTEEFFFQGKAEYLRQVTKTVNIPVLRKDFIFDPYQIDEARSLGADAVLLIAAALPEKLFAQLHERAQKLSLAVLSEVHNEKELAMVKRCGAQIIGINCRNLKTFEVNLDITLDLLGKISSNCLKVAESGIKNADDIKTLKKAGADAFLIGETLMRHGSPGEKLRELLR